MTDNQAKTPSKKEITPQKTPKECSACSCKFKSPAGLRKHKLLKHEGNEESKPQTKKKLVKTAVSAHSGVPPNPKLRKAFEGLKAKLENMKS